MTTATATAVPTIIDGQTVPADQWILATAYMAGIDGPDTVDVTWHSIKGDKQVRAAHRAKAIVSHTTATVERGGTYAERAERVGVDATGGLPYGVWLVEDHLIFHKGQVLVRLYAVSGTLDTTYTADGKTLTRDEYKALVYKQSGGDNPTGCMNVKIQSLIVR